MSDIIVILGASARAAAFSALRAGLEPYFGDCFGDSDLVRRCDGEVTRRYPWSLLSIARRAPAGPWIYTGGVENHARLVDRIAAGRLLLGNSARVLAAVRDPARIAAALSQRGLPSLLVKSSAAGLPRDGTWLMKRVRSAGGIGIQFWNRSAAPVRRRGAHYFQQYLQGPSFAALFIAVAGRAVLLGVTEQLVGCEWTGAGPFTYCGSIGPAPLSARLQAQIEAIGVCFAREFSLQGLFGVDGIVAGEAFWTVEVNPRYTASVEVLERAMGISALRLHVEACWGGVLPGEEAVRQHFARRTLQWCGKAVLYVRADVTVGERFHHWLCEQNGAQDWPGAADIPHARSTIARRHPVTTLFSVAATRDELLCDLRERVAEAEAILHGTPVIGQQPPVQEPTAIPGSQCP